MPSQDLLYYCHTTGIETNYDQHGIFWITTAAIIVIMAVMFALSFCFQKSDRHCASMCRLVSIGLGICIWVLFFCTYAAQINPLIWPSIEGEEDVSGIFPKDPTGDWFS